MQKPNLTSDLDYKVSYVSDKKPEWEFIIQPLTNENFLEVTHHIADIFSKYDPISAVMDLNYEENYECTYRQAEICLTRSIGIVAYEKNSGEFASALLCEDLHKSINYYPEVYAKLPAAEAKVIKWEKGKTPIRTEMEKHYADVENPYEKINLESAVTVEKYHGLGLTTRLARFVIDEHPITKNGKMFYSRVLNPGTEIAFGRCGFIPVIELDYKDMVAHGNDCLERLEKVVEERGLRPCLKYKIVCLDRSAVNS